MDKPELKILEMALKRSGCKAENTIMIGDRLEKIVENSLSFKNTYNVMLNFNK